VASAAGGAAALFESMVFPSRGRCPLCGERPAPGDGVLARFPERTYRRCARCGIVYLVRSAPPPIQYDENYFFAEYRAQYGKTYLEDFAALRQKGRERLERVRRLLSAQYPGQVGRRPRVLDIGCAYGPFLAAAADGGFEPLGVDPAAAAVAYVHDELGLAAVQGTFPAVAAGLLAAGGQFDAVSLWYVIEHFEDAREALTAAAALVRPGGVLAFSTPSFSGVSGRKNHRRFLENSPADHWTIWEPARVGALLRRFGFRLEKIVVTGHHPERFPLFRNGARRGFIHSLLLTISKIFGLGDTFEAYAIRTEDQTEHG
jgi:2-polyprenyl-3-methyl-5-hydroxy-6-metoxy-1,4-benzoquinol methylase